MFTVCLCHVHKYLQSFNFSYNMPFARSLQRVLKRRTPSSLDAQHACVVMEVFSLRSVLVGQHGWPCLSHCVAADTLAVACVLLQELDLVEKGKVRVKGLLEN